MTKSRTTEPKMDGEGHDSRTSFPFRKGKADPKPQTDGLSPHPAECQRHTSSMFPSNHLRWAERDAASGSLPRHRDGWNCPDFRGTREECDGVIPNSLVEVREEPKNKQISHIQSHGPKHVETKMRVSCLRVPKSAFDTS